MQALPSELRLAICIALARTGRWCELGAIARSCGAWRASAADRDVPVVHASGDYAVLLAELVAASLERAGMLHNASLASHVDPDGARWLCGAHDFTAGLAPEERTRTAARLLRSRAWLYLTSDVEAPLPLEAIRVLDSRGSTSTAGLGVDVRAAPDDPDWDWRDFGDDGEDECYCFVLGPGRRRLSFVDGLAALLLAPVWSGRCGALWWRRRAPSRADVLARLRTVTPWCGDVVACVPHRDGDTSAAAWCAHADGVLRWTAHALWRLGSPPLIPSLPRTRDAAASQIGPAAHNNNDDEES